jgi:transposase-like protein
MENETAEIAEVLQSRIPEAVAGIQVNFCKNPKCKNFGKPASTAPQPRGRTSSFHPERDDYKLTGDKVDSALKCLSCGRFTTIKSNRGIKEEFDRITSYLAPNPDEVPSCPVKECPNHLIGISAGKKHYQSFGKTKAGSARYRCKSCLKTFSVENSTINRQTYSHKNALVFALLMGKMPFRRIVKTTHIGMWSIFKKIDFIHKQCMAFAAHRERKLFNGDIPFVRLYIAVDCQVYAVNWSHTNDSNVCMSSICSADNSTGFVFGMNLNYDPSVERAKAEYEAELCADKSRPAAHRRFARLWMPGDYAVVDSRKAAKNIKKLLSESTAKTSLIDEIEEFSDDDTEAAAIEADEAPAITKHPRKFGMQVHSEYTAYAHFQMLNKLTSNTEKVRLFIDQDASFYGASMSAFANRIMGGECDVFYVRIKSEMTIHEKRRAVAATTRAINRLAHEFPYTDWRVREELTERDYNSMLRHELIKRGMENLVPAGNNRDKWLIHPIATMDEAEKSVCFLTDDNQYDKDHVARLYAKASLQSVDKVFNQIRNFISVLGNQRKSKSNKLRQYFPESAYNPERVIKLLEIFRVYHNYHYTGEDKKTPAMRLGLAKAPIDLEDILYFKP